MISRAVDAVFNRLADVSPWLMVMLLIVLAGAAFGVGVKVVAVLLRYGTGVL